MSSCFISYNGCVDYTIEERKKSDLLVVNVWSHQSALHRYAFKSSAVRPTITTGGATIVRTNKPIPTQRQIIPNRFKSVASVIFTALAERTRNTTEILLPRQKSKRQSTTQKKNWAHQLRANKKLYYARYRYRYMYFVKCFLFGTGYCFILSPR